MEYGSTFIVLACIFGFLMACGVGANDVANAMGTSVGSKAVTIRQAIAIATLFEFSGAFLAGGQVTDTLRQGIVDPQLLPHVPELFVIGMLASLLAAAVWLIIATLYGWPVSTTHTVVGAIAGFGCIVGIESIKWAQLGFIVLSWIVSPIIGGILAYALFMSVQYFILNTEHPLENAKKIVPVYIFIACFIIVMVTLVKGLKHIGLHLETFDSIALALGLSLLTTLIGIVMLRRLKLNPDADKSFHFANVERIFGVLMVFTACAMAFAHGSNDVANAIGPLAAVVDMVKSNGIPSNMGSANMVSTWILLLGSVGIVVGLVTYGHKVIATVGQGITELTPSRGFSATFAAACTVVMASGTGLPISTTQTLVGAVLGVGLARGIAALNLNVIGTIFMSWIITLPAGTLLSILFFYLLKFIFIDL